MAPGPGAPSLVCLQLLLLQHSSGSWLSFSGALPCLEAAKDYSPVCPQGLSLPLGLVFIRYHLGEEVKSVLEKGAEAESHSCPQVQLRWHSKKAREGDAQHPTSPEAGYGPVATIQIPPLSCGWPSGLIQCSNRISSCYYVPVMCLASQQPSREAVLVPILQMRRARPSIVQPLAKGYS